MFKKIIIHVLLIGVIAWFFAGCATDTTTPSKTVVAQATTDQPTATPEPVEEPVAENLTGTWRSADDAVVFNAEVSLNAIQMTMTAGDSEGLYWAGTFIPEAEDGTKIVSKGEIDLMSKSLFGSQDKTKQFTFEDGQLSFKFTMMGVTKTVKLEK